MTTLHKHTLGSGQDLVLLHGWGMHSGIWDAILPALTEHFRVTLIDLPGYGHNTHYDCTYQLDALVDTILQVSPKQAHYVSWSMGGLISLAIAKLSPNAINKLAFFASTPKFIATSEWPGINSDIFTNFKQSFLNNTEKTYNDFLHLQCFGLKKHKKTYKSLQNLTPITKNKVILLRGLELLENTNLLTTAKQIGHSQYYIFGEHDQLIPALTATALKNNMIKTDMISGASHIPFLTHTELCSKLLVSYLYD